VNFHWLTATVPLAADAVHDTGVDEPRVIVAGVQLILMVSGGAGVRVACLILRRSAAGME
jgi:hypothetical protein